MQKEHFYNHVKNPSLLNRDSLEELKNISSGFPYFQAALLLYLKNLKETGNSGFEAELNRTAPLLPDRKQLYKLLHSRAGQPATGYEPDYPQTEGYAMEYRDKPTEGESLIDKFLASARAGEKIETRTPEEISREIGNKLTSRSASESDELITETLAMIYLEQKKYDKALEAFKKLNLKYPEKSIYFVARIEEIEKLKNI
ncbi:MAG: tetratricopeptide repeat protein [Mariniphaga sp.]|jgi:tetratricopeptide (TPR) repeat protein|nr:tetratricopeptide repeat protein [Mariniphaga sp.]